MNPVEEVLVLPIPLLNIANEFAFGFCEAVYVFKPGHDLVFFDFVVAVAFGFDIVWILVYHAVMYYEGMKLDYAFYHAWGEFVQIVAA